MISEKDVQELFDISKAKEREEELKRKAYRGEILEAQHQARMLEYMIDNLNVNALMAVHITDHFPNGGKITPTGHFLVNYFDSHNARKVIEDAQLFSPRITIHFTLNYAIKGVVAHGKWVSWKGKYVILIPLKDIIDRIVCLNPVDSWIIGSLVLPKSAEILIPLKEYRRDPQMWAEHAGHANIIPFLAEKSPAEAAEDRIRVKGYRVTDGGDHGWFENDSALGNLNRFLSGSEFLSFEEIDRLRRICVEKGYNYWPQVFGEIAKKLKKISSPHYKTEWRNLELFFEGVLGFIFEPYHDERQEAAREFLKRIISSMGEAERYGKAIRGLIDEKRFPSAEEKESLLKLEEGFLNLIRFLDDLREKLQETGETVSWEAFLKGEGILA